MTQQEFNNLSKRYLEGKTTAEENQNLLEWHKNQAGYEIKKLDEPQKKKLEKDIWRGIQQQLPTRKRKLTPWVIWLSAAAATFLSLYWFFAEAFSPFHPTQAPIAAQQTEQVGIEMSNTTSAEQKVTLEDGTTVLLKQHSSILYDKDFNKTRREVYLTGEAFFEVKRDENKPFIVHAGALVTEVLGTSFRIKPIPQSNAIEVVVKTGKVSVYTENPNRNNDHNGVILTPNQRVLFDESSQNIIPSIVENPVPLERLETAIPHLIFESTPLQTVLDRLSSVYGIEFVITNPKTSECQITADLNGLSMFTQLELICKSIDATYEKRGTVVFINGDGC